MFCGEQLLWARLRESNRDASFGCAAEIEGIVQQMGSAGPEVKILLGGDSGFCRNVWMGWCEQHKVDLVIGRARNQRLGKILGAELHQAREQWKQTGTPARVFSEFHYRTKKTKPGGWERERRVAAKAEHLNGKEHPRFVVTSLSTQEWSAQKVYEDLDCARGDRENRIQEQFSLFADRVSSETMRAHPRRLSLSSRA